MLMSVTVTMVAAHRLVQTKVELMNARAQVVTLSMQTKRAVMVSLNDIFIGKQHF